MKTHIMLDLETFGTAPGSAILAIGAVVFSSGELKQEFYTRIDLKSCLQYDLKMDADTVLWWLKQGEEARMEMVKEGTFIGTALRHFSEWVGTVAGPDVQVWGNGVGFDNALLAEAYRRTGNTPPWKYSNDRCYRTVKNLFPDVVMMRNGTHHNALDDARSQARHLMVMLPNL